MKCNRHPGEQGVGVCAPCLRDRLLIILAEQQTHPSTETPNRRETTLPVPTVDSRSHSRILHGCNAFSLFPSLSALIHRHSNGNNQKNKKKKKKTRYGPSDRGMSPAIDDQETDTNTNTSASGYTTDSSAGIRRHTTPAPPVVGGGFAGFSVCLNPLVRPNHAGRRQRRQPETAAGYSGELGRNGNPVRLGPNRSRKMADRGRSWR